VHNCRPIIIRPRITVHWPFRVFSSISLRLSASDDDAVVGFAVAVSATRVLTSASTLSSSSSASSTVFFSSPAKRRSMNSKDL